jgi:hypothetical protein
MPTEETVVTELVVTDSPADNVENTAREMRQSMGAVKLSFSWLGTQRKLSDAQTKQAAEMFAASTDLVTASKKLIDTKHPAYKAATAIKSQASAFWRGLTLPYPQEGVRLIRQADVTTFEERMSDFKAQLDAAVANLQLEYEVIKEKAREKLGSLYNAEDYPSTLEGVFSISWEYPPIEPPQYLMTFNPQLYEQERSRIQHRFEEAVTLAENAFADELSGLISHLVERLTDEPDGKKKAFKASTIENFKEFYQNFQRMNVRSNANLESLISQANNLVSGITPNDLRQSNELQNALRTQMSELKTSLDSVIREAPRRRILRME